MTVVMEIPLANAHELSVVESLGDAFAGYHELAQRPFHVYLVNRGGQCPKKKKLKEEKKQKPFCSPRHAVGLEVPINSVCSQTHCKPSVS